MVGVTAAFEVFGVIGGVCISLSLVPQVIHTYKTKSVGDISYLYQCLYILGCTFTNIYAIGLGLWPIYVTVLLEQSLIMTLTLMKYMYEKDEDVCPNQAYTEVSTTSTEESEELEEGGGEGDEDEEIAVNVEATSQNGSRNLQNSGLDNEIMPISDRQSTQKFPNYSTMP